MSEPSNIWIVYCLVSTFLSILFIQSGLDKLLDWRGNLDWLKGHFSKSFLSGTVPILLLGITVVEIAAGLLSAFGVTELALLHLFQIGIELPFDFVLNGTVLSAIALIMLFFGQRIAKDYEGAATLVPYFLLVTFYLYILLN